MHRMNPWPRNCDVGVSRIEEFRVVQREIETEERAGGVCRERDVSDAQVSEEVGEGVAADLEELVSGDGGAVGADAGTGRVDDADGVAGGEGGPGHAEEGGGHWGAEEEEDFVLCGGGRGGGGGGGGIVWVVAKVCVGDLEGLSEAEGVGRFGGQGECAVEAWVGDVFGCIFLGEGIARLRGLRCCWGSFCVWNDGHGGGHGLLAYLNDWLYLRRASSRGSIHRSAQRDDQDVKEDPSSQLRRAADSKYIGSGITIPSTGRGLESLKSIIGFLYTMP